MVKLLEVSKYDKKDIETKPRLDSAAANVSAGIDQLIKDLRTMPGNQNLSLHGADLNVIASEALNDALTNIKAQALDLMSSKKLTKAKKASDVDQTDINNALYDASAAIAQATSAVVGLGVQVQKKRVAELNDLTKGRNVKTDTTALSALIASAKETSNAVSGLAGTTKTSVIKLEEKNLVNSANSVTTAIAHITIALKASIPEKDSDLLVTLDDANEKVTQATSLLMTAVHRASSFNEVYETELPEESVGKVKELEIQIKILKLDKDIKREKNKLERMKKGSEEQKK